MTRLTTYVHDYPVRASDVTYQMVVRKLAQYEDTGLAPEEIQLLQDKLASERMVTISMERVYHDVLKKLVAARTELEKLKKERPRLFGFVRPKKEEVE